MIRLHELPTERADDFDLGMLVLLQDEGMKARSWGMSERDNPALSQEQTHLDNFSRTDWSLRYEAWLFGWRIEDSWLRGIFQEQGSQASPSSSR
jgi:hypothetical protein